MKKGFVLFLGFLIWGNLWAVRPELDSTAYTRWRRIDDYSISENGIWVKFRYVYIDNTEANKKSSGCYYFYNTRTGKIRKLEDMEHPEFFAGGNWIRYTDKSEENRRQTVFMDLAADRKIYWNRPQEPDCHRGTSLVSYSAGEDCRIFIRLPGGDSVVYKELGRYELLAGGTELLYVWKGEKAYELRYGELFSKEGYRLIFRDTTRTLKSFRWMNGEGGFELEYTENTGCYRQVWRFDTKGGAEMLTDTRKWNLCGEYSPRNIRMLGKGRWWEFESTPIRKPVKHVERRRDTSFELELWSWKDPMIQSEQNVSGYRKPLFQGERYLYDSRRGEAHKLCGSGYSSVHYQPVDEPHYVLLADNTAFKKRKDWQYMERKDYALADMLSGEIRYFARQQTRPALWSPDGRYVIFYDDKERAWMRLEPRNLKVENISEYIGHPVYDELCDRPHPAEPYGLAGWSKDGSKLYIYDRFDIWRVDMDDIRHPFCLTRGQGRREKTAIRFLNVYFSTRMTVDESKPLYVELFDWKTMDSGIAELSVSGKLRKGMFGPFMFQTAGMSKDGRKLLLSRQSFSEGRNLWIYDLKTRKSVRISDANPEHHGYQWGSVKMVEWKNFEGRQNRGLLYLPYGYDASKSYPLIVNYYETHSPELHIYHLPGWSSAMLDIPTFLSNGYVIFRPDVYFTVGEPARSTYNAVVSGVEYLVGRGIADPERIGIQGHSWSGCTAAQLLTMTDIFCCASIGAGVVNLTEAYTALREGSGNTRMFMYEDWQCRMGKSLWEAPEAYIRNSSILYADRIKTPVLIMHNDKDEAVAYREGRNLYLALRRLSRPVWLLNYKGEGHFIGNEAAQRDWSRRMLQFFDHYMKRLPPPRWMVEGININERGFDNKYELIFSAFH